MSVNNVYAKRTEKDFEETVISVLRAAGKEGWSVLQVLDLQERIRAKGFSAGRLRIIEVCSAKYSSRLLEENPQGAVFLPCRIAVYERDGAVEVAALLPGIIRGELEGVGEFKEVEDAIRRMVDSSV